MNNSSSNCSVVLLVFQNLWSTVQPNVIDQEIRPTRSSYAALMLSSELYFSNITNCSCVSLPYFHHVYLLVHKKTFMNILKGLGFIYWYTYFENLFKKLAHICHNYIRKYMTLGAFPAYFEFDQCMGNFDRRKYGKSTWYIWGMSQRTWKSTFRKI